MVSRSDERPRIAFFDYPDVFEDFYPHYGVSQQEFATRWADTGNHAFLALIQENLADVIWYTFSLKPELDGAIHDIVGCRVNFIRSSVFHRTLWRSFYLPRCAWRWRRAYPIYALLASYTALWSSSFCRAIRRDSPDVFFVQDYCSGRYDCLVLLARFLKIPVISYHSGSTPQDYVGRLAKRWSIPAASRIFVSSSTERQRLMLRYNVDPNRLEVILTPINTDIFRPLDRAFAAEISELPANRRYILYVGRLRNDVKRVDWCIRDFADLAGRHPDVDLVIAGDGPDAAKLRKLARQRCPERIHFLGWISDNMHKAALYNMAECLVLPSRREGFPTVVGEAAACGTPVLASDVGGVGEVVMENQSGWLFQPDDRDSFSNGLAAVLANPKMISKMRVATRDIAVATVSPDVVSSRLGASINRVCNENR